MAQIFENLEFFAAQTQFFTGSLQRQFTYDGYLPDDAFATGQIPKDGSTVQIAGLTMVARGYAIKKIRDDAGTITVNYSTASSANPLFKPFDLTYKKVDYRLPVFARGVHNYMDQSNTMQTRDWWYAQDVHIPVEFTTLSVTVHRYLPGAVSNQGHQQDIARVLPLVNTLQNLPGFGFMVMQPPAFRQTSYLNADITYTWVGDPGNGTLGDLGADAADFIIPDARPAWYQYIVRPAKGLDGTMPDGKPKVALANLFPAQLPNGQANPFVQPTGWRSLPGNPLG